MVLVNGLIKHELILSMECQVQLDDRLNFFFSFLSQFSPKYSNFDLILEYSDFYAISSNESVKSHKHFLIFSRLLSWVFLMPHSSETQWKWVCKFRPVARIDFGGCTTPKKWTFWTQKVAFLNLTPLLILQQKPYFWHTLWLEVSRFGVVCRTPPLATGLGKFQRYKQVRFSKYSRSKKNKGTKDVHSRINI